MHFQYTVLGPFDEFHGFIQICYYECPHVSGIYLESLLITKQNKIGSLMGNWHSADHIAEDHIHTEKEIVKNRK